MPELISPLETYHDAAPDEAPEGGMSEDLDAVRELVLRAHRDVVPELVSGDSIAGILASVEPARVAYARLAESWTEEAPRAVPAPAVPAGGGGPLPVDPAQLPAAEKIRRGLAADAHRRSSRSS